MADDASDDTFVDLLTWLTEHKSWDVLDAFLAKHQTRLEQSKRPLYYAALARAEQGKNDLAEQLAEQARRDSTRRPRWKASATAKDLEEHGQFDWAVREYRRAIDKQPRRLARSHSRAHFAGQPAARLRAATKRRPRRWSRSSKPCKAKAMSASSTPRFSDYISAAMDLDLPDSESLAAATISIAPASIATKRIGSAQRG